MCGVDNVFLEDMMQDITDDIMLDDGCIGIAIDLLADISDNTDGELIDQVK